MVVVAGAALTAIAPVAATAIVSSSVGTALAVMGGAGAVTLASGIRV
ncbi:MAG: hypothetical protein WA421_18535 [Nitrososphaeraceae archaeon]